MVQCTSFENASFNNDCKIKGYICLIEEEIKIKKQQLFLKRGFDIVVSSVGIILISPLLLVIAIKIKQDSKGTVFFKQQRVGKNGKPFNILKFRTMSMENKGKQITVANDKRITKYGTKLRSSKLDELPQLFNVWLGNMSFVGPRPEVPKYVAMYNEEQKRILSIKPGITDLASIEFRHESDLLAKAEDPEKYYISEIMPKKIGFNLEYMRNVTVSNDVSLILRTLRILRGKG